MRSAVLMPNWIGDCVLALSVIERKRKHGTEELSLLAPEPLVSLLRRLTDIPVFPVARTSAQARQQTLRDVRAQQFDKVYLLPYSFSSALFAFRAGIRRRRGIAKDGRSILLTERLPKALRDYTQHICREYAGVLDTECEPVESWTRYRSVSPAQECSGAVVFCPGARFGPAKQWQGFAELASLLAGEKIVVAGSAGDSAGLQGLPNVEDTTGTTTLAEAAAILAAAKIVVANDSGLMHVAAYLGTAVIGVFGSTTPAWTRPLGERVRIAYSGERCSPCFSRTCKYGHYRCLRSISPQQVAACIQELAP